MLRITARADLSIVGLKSVERLLEFNIPPGQVGAVIPGCLVSMCPKLAARAVRGLTLRVAYELVDWSIVFSE